MKSTTLIFLLSGLILAVSHYLAIEFMLYWRYLWLDIPMHLLGGTVVGLGYLSLSDLFPRLPKWLFSLMMTVWIVISVAIAWEIFEIAIGTVFDEVHYVRDTIADLICGVIGGVLAHIVHRNIAYLYE